MKIIGMTMIILSAVVFSYERGAAEDRRLGTLEELLRFIERVRLDISCYLRPVSEIAADFSSELLEKNGFLRDLQKVGAYKAYTSLMPTLALGEEEKKLLERFFSTLGTGYAEDEIKLIDTTVKALSDFIRGERERVPKQKKLSLTLSCAAALALIILLI